MKQRHLSKRELLMQCNAIAREKRMASRTPWTIMSILCSYCIMTAENFKGQRLVRIINAVNELEEKYDNNSIDLEKLQDEIFEKVSFKIKSDTYEESDITHKKGSFNYWLDSRQIEAQNEMNKQASRYMVFFYHTLITEFEFGEKRITRVDELLSKNMKEYQTNRALIIDWKKALKEEAGLVIEMPVDPLTQTSGSLMTGYL